MIPKRLPRINENAVDNKLYSVKDQFTRPDTGCIKFSGIEQGNSLKYFNSSQNMCNREEKRVKFQDNLIKRGCVHFKVPNVRNSEVYQSETDRSESALSNNGVHLEITSNLHPQSKSPDVSISEVHQCEIDSIYSSPSPDNFDSGQCERRIQKTTITETESESSFLTTEPSYVINSNEDEVIHEIILDRAPYSNSLVISESILESESVFIVNASSTSETIHTELHESNLDVKVSSYVLNIYTLCRSYDIQSI